MYIEDGNNSCVPKFDYKLVEGEGLEMKNNIKINWEYLISEYSEILNKKIDERVEEKIMELVKRDALYDREELTW